MTTNKKITELSELAEVDLSDDDVLAIVDVSAGTTNKVRKSTLASALAGVASLSATSPVTVSSAVGAVTVAVTTIPITSGGTGATNASAARTNLGVPASGDLSDFVTGPASATDNTVARYDNTTGKLIQGSGVTIDDSNNLDAASITLTTDLAVAHGGTGSSTAGGARTNLGAGDVSGPASATDSALALFDGTTGKLIKDSTYPITAAGAALLDDADASAQRTTLGAAGSDSSVTTAMIADNAVDETKLKDALIGDFTEVVATASDTILLGDATDSGNTKRDTVQGILDLVPAAEAVTQQNFDTSGTWTKPGSGTYALVEAWGGGGSGGNTTSSGGGGGGGGGAYVFARFLLSDLGSTESATIGAGGAAVGATNTTGNVGGTTTFGSLVSAFGGGGGGYSVNGGGGGGGGGAFEAGSTPSAGSGGAAAGGGPGGGDAVAAVNAGNPATSGYGGGGGSSRSSTEAGGQSHFGGGGGGGSATAAGDGGASFSGGGGGGAAGATPGAGGVSGAGGNGGAGSTGAATSNSGSQPAGGGGGADGGTSGAGGAGRVRVTVW